MNAIGLANGDNGGYAIIEDYQVKETCNYSSLFRIKNFSIDLTRNTEGGSPAKKFKNLDELFKRLTQVVDLKKTYSIGLSTCMSNTCDQLFKHYLDKYTITTSSVKSFHHKLCHAASAYYLNELDDSLIVVIDFDGNGKIAVYHGIDQSIQNVKLYHRLNLGEVYSFTADYIMRELAKLTTKLDVLEVNGKFMAYANTGTYNSKVYSIINSTIFGEFSPEDDQFIFDFHYKDESWLFLDDYFNKIELLYRASKVSVKDFAFNFQMCWISKVLDVIGIYKHLSKNLCVSGGSFLNIGLNYHLLQRSWFENVRFTPLTDDSGQALGGALLCIF